MKLQWLAQLQTEALIFGLEIQTNRSRPYFTEPMIQNLADDTRRINILQEVFFLTRIQSELGSQRILCLLLAHQSDISECSGQNFVWNLVSFCLAKCDY